MICRASCIHTIFKFCANTIANGNFNSSTFRRTCPHLSKTKQHRHKSSSLEKPTNTKSTYIGILKECVDIFEVKKIHTHMIKTGFRLRTILYNCLINKYAECGCLEYARQVFDKMPDRDVVSWNSLIGGYLKCGYDAEALQLYSRMKREELWPTQSTFVTVLLAIVDVEALEKAKQLHAHIVKFGFGLDVSVDNPLLRAYLKCGSFEDACRVFDKMPLRDDVSWNVMLAGCAKLGYIEEGLGVVRQMMKEGVCVSGFSLSGVLSACGCLEFGELGRQFHVYVLKSGLHKDVSVGNGLISMYSKYESVDDAYRVFGELDRKDVVSWNTMIGGYAQNGYGDVGVMLFVEMQMVGVKSNQSTVASFVSSCGGITCFEKAKQVHAQIKKIGVDMDVSAENAIVSMYVRSGSVDYAYRVFETMMTRNVVSWNAMISGFVQYGNGEEALMLFNEMQWEGLKVNHITVSSALNACSSMESLPHGKQLHSNIVKTGLETKAYVGNALLIMYDECGSIEDVHRQFTKMPARDVFSWNMMIAGYAQNGDSDAAIDLFWKMQQAGMLFNEFTLANVLSSCLRPENLGKGKRVHTYIIKMGFEFDVALMNALITMYNNCGSVGEAYKLFKEMTAQDAISWSAMIAGLAQYGYSEEALGLSCQMHLVGMKISHMIFPSVLRACANLAALEQGKQFHAQSIRNGIEDTSVGNAIVTMYSKCACIEDARKVFENMARQDLISWNAMIAGLAQHGQGKEALDLFDRMQAAGTKPDHITYVGVLSACSHVGLVEEGHHYFNSMKQDHGISPREEHYSCMVDLLSRAGQLADAESFINKMSFEPGSLVWRTLLGACRVHGNVELGKRAADYLLKLEPQDTATYVLLSNIYASAGRWNDRTHVRKMMKERKVNKEPGCSWIQVKERMHAFLAGDSLPESMQIYCE